MLNFTKMHGIGNDYVYVNCFKETVRNPEAVSRFVSDRHFGIGSDGLILICPSDVADFRMRMYNADGSEGMMCGNGTRCVGKYVYDNKMTDKETITLETKSGIKTLKFFVKDGKVDTVEVDMGKAILKPVLIPVIADGDDFINKEVEVNGKTVRLTCVSMGNPHAVLYTQGVDGLNLEEIGPHYENHKMFPDRVNTEFVEIIDKNTVKMRVWERGSGETFACGTGACAVAVSCVLNGYFRYDEENTIKLRGGDLKITVLKDLTVKMRGTATKVFDGTIDIEEFI